MTREEVFLVIREALVHSRYTHGHVVPNVDPFALNREGDATVYAAAALDALEKAGAVRFDAYSP